MKRIWIGIGFLVGLLVLGMAVMKITDRQMGEISQALQEASESTDWASAVTLAQTAQRIWEENNHLMAALSDHADLDTVDQLFSQLKVYQQRKEQTHHAALCAQLSEAIRALEENHHLTWWNLL